MIPPALLAAIHAGADFLVLSHIRPDGDAVGSLLGMAGILRTLGKRVTVALQDRPGDELLAVPGAEAILGPDDRDRLYSHPFDTIISTDASSVDRLGALYGDHAWGAPLLVIDHHVTNTAFGDVNWVSPTDTATCQMLVRLADALGVELAGDLAQVLLTGLVTDTLCFRTNNTTPAVLETGMRLLAAGGDLAAITEEILDQRPFEVLRLWGLVLDDAQMEEGVVWVTVSSEQFARSGADIRNDGSLSSMLIRTEGADISATFLEKLGDQGQPAVECSFRARRGFNISGVAADFGGGGHPAAGGVTIDGDLQSVAALVVARLKETRREQRIPPDAG